MTSEAWAVVYFALIVTLWVLLPIVPAWLTYRITPQQKLAVKGPLSGLTLNATGSFGAYLVMALLLSRVAIPVVELVVGAAASNVFWEITGKTLVHDADGNKVEQRPQPMQLAKVRVVPDQNVFDENLSVKALLPADPASAVVYIDVPDWGGAKISLGDTESYSVYPLTRTIALKGVVIFREKPRKALGVGNVASAALTSPVDRQAAGGLP